MIEFSLSDFDGNRLREEPVFRREAVRAVIFRNDRLLMIYSPVNGDYKFPGGGIEPEETGEGALKREVREECGTELAAIGRQIGRVTEERPCPDKNFDRLFMTSSYYLCTVDRSIFEEQQLDGYEEELGFTPLWISPEEALSANEAVLAGSRTPPPWTKRETLFLKRLIAKEE